MELRGGAPSFCTLADLRNRAACFPPPDIVWRQVRSLNKKNKKKEMLKMVVHVTTRISWV
jgi:hypothetical protein